MQCLDLRSLVCGLVIADRRMLLLSMLYRLLRCLLGLTAVLMRRDLSKDVELLVLSGHFRVVVG